jgi:hypothetical protein
VPAPPRRTPAKTTADDEGTDWKKIFKVAVVLTVLLCGVYYLFTGSFGLRRRSTYEAQGIVFFKGKPAAGARITLFPEQKSRDRYYPTGKVADDGSFKLTTYNQDDGAPLGRYKVTIVRGVIEGEEWVELNQKFTPDQLKQIILDKSRDELLEKYSNPETSNLTAEITSQTPNKLKFEIN